MTTRIAFRNFTGGEVTPTLSARYDLQKFGTFLQLCENFIPNMHGDIERRPGTYFVSELSEPSVLMPFSFNTEAAENFALIFQREKILVASATGILDGVSIQSPYDIKDIYGISAAQVADVVYLAHKKYPLQKLVRTGSAPHFSWSLEEVHLNTSIPAPDTPRVVWHRGPKNSESDDEYMQNESYDLRYVVTAVDDDGMESLASGVGEIKARYPTDWVQGDYAKVLWNKVPGATEYNVYRESAGYFGFVGTVKERNKSSAPSMNGLLVNGKLFVADKKLSLAPNSGAEGVVSYTIKSSNDYWLSWYNDEVNQRFVARDIGGTILWHLIETSAYNGTIEAEQVISSSGWGSSTEYPLGTAEGVTVTKSFVSGDYAFTDQNFEPDTAHTPKEDWNPFVDGNNPATVAFHQQRMVLGGTKNQPTTFYMSRTGDYENFRKSRPLQDDDPVEYMIASGAIDEIKWITSFGHLLIGTSGAEYEVSSSGAAITPSDVTIRTGSFWGSSRIQPLVIGNSIIHCQRAGSRIRDLMYSLEKDGYAGNDLSVLAPHLVEGHTLRQWAFQQSPGSVVWIVRDDGVLLALTYMSEQNVFGWSRHVTDGHVLSICSLSGDGEDVVMMVVQRGARYFLERLANRFQDADPIETAMFVDCAKTFTFPEPESVVSGLDYLEGRSVAVLADGSPEMDHVVTDGKIELRSPASVVTVGLNFASVMAPMPIETDANGSTLGKRRGYGKCVLRLFRSIGGSYAATRNGDLYNRESWRQRSFFVLPFLPDRLGEAVQPFSGDIELSFPSGLDSDTSIILKQDRPMPFRLVALMADVEIAER